MIVMSDYISRQAAIDEAKKLLDYYGTNDISKEFADHTAEQFMNRVPSAQLDLDEWCTDCSEYDQERHCCPRWNRVIRQTLKDAQSERKWIPVKMRPMDSEEREYWEDQFGEELEDEDAVMFDCLMPEDGQEILVSYRKWISMDKCEIYGGCYGLEENGDWEYVIAWMPLPEPYKGEEA